MLHPLHHTYIHMYVCKRYVTNMCSDAPMRLSWFSLFLVGFVGLFDIFILFPVLVVWNYSQLETFELPPTSHIWTLLIVNGFVGTVLSELLWLM